MTDRTVFIVDDDPVVRDSIAFMLQTAGFSVIKFSSADEFLNAYNSDQRGCIILDVYMPKMDGPTLSTELRRRGSLLPVIFLTAYGTIPLAVQAIRDGAEDFLSKPVDSSLLIARVQQAMQQNYKIAEQRHEHKQALELLSALSNREREIVDLLVIGQSNKEIARALDISSRTVEGHRARIMKKTGLANAVELSRLYSIANPSMENRINESAV